MLESMLWGDFLVLVVGWEGRVRTRNSRRGGRGGCGDDGKGVAIHRISGSLSV